MFEGKCDVVAMAEEELDKQDQKESQSGVIRAIRDVDIAIDQIRESFSLISSSVVQSIQSVAVGRASRRLMPISIPHASQKP